jgi:hypothetical protein
MGCKEAVRGNEGYIIVVLNSYRLSYDGRIFMPEGLIIQC